MSAREEATEFKSSSSPNKVDMLWSGLMIALFSSSGLDVWSVEYPCELVPGILIRYGGLINLDGSTP